MRSGSKIHHVLETTDPRGAGALFGRILEAEGISVLQMRRRADGFEIDGGSDFLGAAFLMIPVSLFTGHGLDVLVHVRGQRSLDPGDDRIHVWVHVTALHEWGHGAYAGLPYANALQCRRVARRIAARFDAGDVPEGDGAVTGAGANAQATSGLPDGVRLRKRRIGRRLLRIEAVLVAAALLVWVGWTCFDSRPSSPSASGDATVIRTRPPGEDAQAMAAREALREEIARGARTPQEREVLESLLDRVHEGAWRRASELAAAEQRPVGGSDYRTAVRAAMLMHAVDDPLLLIRIQVLLGKPD